MPRRSLTTAVAAFLALTLTLAGCATSPNEQTSSSLPVTTSTALDAALVPSLLPEPSGPHPVGVRTVPSVSPQAITRVWYPAQPGTGTDGVPYITKAVAAALGVSPPQLHEARLRARENAEPARAARPRPVVVVMPGWGLFMASLTALAQDLASNGYIVVGIDPAVGTEDPLTLPADVTNPGRRIEQLAAALSFVTGPRITALAGPVDPMRIAVGGHSIAGPVAFQTALTDPRVGAVFDLDGRLASSATRAFAQFPFLLVNASDLGPATTEIVARARNAVTVKLEGATHLDVTDIPCLAPAFGAGAKSLLGIGTIGCTGTTTTNTVVRRFLDAALQTRSTVPSAADLSKGLDGVIPAARPR